TPLLFAIGGSDGFSEEARRQAGFTLSLGKMTLPHELARVVLVEQLYRAFTILKNQPYHLGHYLYGNGAAASQPRSRELDSQPRCTSGSFPGTRNWLSVFLDRQNKSEFAGEALPNENPVRRTKNEGAGTDAGPQRDGRSADLSALAGCRGSGRSERRRSA